MHMSYFTRILKDNEEPLALIRRHWLIFLKPTLIALIFLTLPFFLMFGLFRYGLAGFIFFVALLIGGLIALFKLMAAWSNNVLLLTSQRLIYFFPPSKNRTGIISVPYGEIAEVAYRFPGFWHKAWRFGHLKITKVDQSFLIISNLPGLIKVYQLILTVKKAARADN